MTELRQYDPIRVIGSFSTAAGSVDILDGTIDPGDFVTVASDNPRWARERDRGGNATRVKMNNRGGLVTVNLSASSPTNTKLSTLVQIDGVSENVVGVLLLRDLNGNSVVTATGAFISDIPDPSFGSDRGTRAWVWECAEIEKFVGGHDIA